MTGVDCRDVTEIFVQSVAQFGRALVLGTRGRWSDSNHFDSPVLKQHVAFSTQH